MPVEKCALPPDRNSWKKLWSLTLVSFKIKDLPSSGFVIFKNCVKGPFPDLFRASRDGMRLKPTFGWLLGSGKCKSKGDDPWIEGLGFSTSQMFKGSGLFRYYWWSACFFCFVLFCFVLFCFFIFLFFFSASFGFTIKIWEGFRFEKIPRRCRRLLRNNEFVRYSSLIRVEYLLLFTEIESINFLCFGFRSKKSHVLMSCTDEAIHASMGELKSMSPQAFCKTVPLLYQLLANNVRLNRRSCLVQFIWILYSWWWRRSNLIMSFNFSNEDLSRIFAFTLILPYKQSLWHLEFTT